MKQGGRPRRALFIIVIVILFFVSAELFLRATGLAESRLDEVYSDIYDVEYVMSPGSPNPYSMKGETLNAQGLRGPAFPMERPAGVLRVICLGDSTTFGLEEIEDSFPYMMQQILDAELGEDRAQVINAGIPGTGFTQQLLFFQRALRPYRPDVVCLTGGPNYRPDIKGYRNRLESETFQRLYTVRGILARLEVYRLLRRLIKGGPSEFVMDDSQISAPAGESGRYLMDYWEDLERMRSISREDGFGLVFFNVPHLELIQEMQRRGARPGSPEYRDAIWRFTPDHLTGRFAEKYGYPYIDTAQGFIGPPIDRDLFFDPNHPGPVGNRIIAEELSKAVLAVAGGPGAL